MSLKRLLVVLLVVATVIPIFFVHTIAGGANETNQDDDILLLVLPILSVISNLGDISPPQIDSISTSTTSESIVISGLALQLATVSLYQNGRFERNVSTNNSGRFSSRFSLSPGLNTFYGIQSLNGQTSRKSNSIQINRVSNNRLPIAFIVYGPSSGEVPLVVNFDGTRSSDSDGSISSYSWNFGDGVTSGGATTSHTFTTPGSYTSVLTVIDNLGGRSTSPVQVTVRPTTTPPVSILQFRTSDPVARSSPLEVIFDGSESYDDDGTIIGYNWNLGDGTIASSQSVSHTYTTPGRYTVVLSVVDNSLRTSTSIAQVEVLDPIVSRFTINAETGEAPFYIEVNGMQSSGYVKSYQWDFGDGDIKRHAASDYRVGIEKKLYKEPGVYEVKLTTTDIFGKKSSSTKSITVLPNNPDNDLDFSAELTSTSPSYFVDFSVVASDIVPGLTYLFDFGDGSSGSGPIISHQYSQSGIYTVEVSAISSNGVVTKSSGINLFIGRELGGVNIGIDKYEAIIPEIVGSYYLLSDQSLIVEERGRLSIMPGVEIRAINAGVIAEGDMVVSGTNEKPIRFTSSATAPESGDWYGMTIKGDQSFGLQQTTIEYASFGVDASQASGYLTISESHFSHNRFGITAKKLDLTVDNSSFTDTNGSAIEFSEGIYNVRDVQINDGTDCVVLDGDGVIENSTISSCLQSGIRLKGSGVIRNNEISGINEFDELNGPTELIHISQVVYAGPSAAIVIDGYDKDVTLAGNNLHNNHVGIQYFSNVLIPYSDVNGWFDFDTGFNRNDHPPYTPRRQTQLVWRPDIVGNNRIYDNEVGLLLKFPGYLLKGNGLTSAYNYPTIEISPTIRNNSFFNNANNVAVTGTFGFKDIDNIDVGENWWGTIDPNEIYESMSILRNGILTISSLNNPERYFNIESFLDAEAELGTPAYPGDYLFGVVDDQDFQINASYNVVGPIIVKDQSVTIPEGVILKFLGKKGHMDLQGELSVDGVTNNMVRFTSLSNNPQSGDWGGISLGFNSTADIENSVIEFANGGITGQGNLLVSHSTIRENIVGISATSGTQSIQNSELVENAVGIRLVNSNGGSLDNNVIDENTTGVVVKNLLNNVSIANNQINNNDQVGISIEQRIGEGLTIQSNAIESNGVGIKMIPRTIRPNSLQPNITGGNSIVGNSVGIEIGFRPYASITPTIRGNTIANNTRYNVVSDRNDTFQDQTTIDAQLNWWGTTDPLIIEQSIYDRMDSPGEALINFAGLLSSEGSIGDVDGKAPIAIIQFDPADPKAFSNIALDASSSSDSDGSILNYRWVFGDGSTSDGPVTTKYLNSAGSLSVQLEVTDNDGIVGFTTATIPVQVANPNFNINLSANPLTTHVLQNVQFSASGSTSDLGDIISYTWDFGDGQSASDAQTSHSYQGSGEFVVTVTVTDDRGFSAQNGTIVTVQEQSLDLAAQIGFISSSGEVPFQLHYDGSGSAGGVGGIEYQWDFGDGRSENSVSGSHTYLEPGEYDVTLTVTDGGGDQDTVIDKVIVSEPVLNLSIISPGNNSSASESSVLVSGTVANIFDMGVTIEANGGIYFAMVDRSQQPARFRYQVPIREGTNEIKVTATTQYGSVEEIILNVAGLGAPDQDFAVSIDRPSAYVSEQMLVNIKNLLDKTAIQGSGYGFDYDLDGTVDLVGEFESSEIAALNEGELSFSFSFPQGGVYNLHSIIRVSSGQTYTSILPIEIIDPLAIDQLIQDKWNKLNQALLDGDALKALGYFSTSKREKYRPVVNLLLPGFQNILASYTSLQLTDPQESYLEYVLNREIDGIDRVFFVYFNKDSDGLWRLMSL